MLAKSAVAAACTLVYPSSLTSTAALQLQGRVRDKQHTAINLLLLVYITSKRTYLIIVRILESRQGNQTMGIWC